MIRTLLTLGIAVFLASAFYFGLLRLNYPSAKKFPVQGVDVSHHQGAIDWARVRENGVQFAYLKATEGGDFKDPRFVDNWIRCRYAGVATGAYHFFSFCRPGTEQAANFLATVPLEPGCLPPALDLEFGGNCGRVPTQADMERQITAFVSAISGRFSGPPVFYATSDFYRRYLSASKSNFPAHRLWIRDVLREPEQKPGSEWTLWQFTGRGHMSGIRGLVDLNVYSGSTEQFEEFRQGTSQGRTDLPALWKTHP